MSIKEKDNVTDNMEPEVDKIELIKTEPELSETDKTEKSSQKTKNSSEKNGKNKNIKKKSNKKKSRKRSKKQRVIYTVLMLVFFAIFLGCAIYLFVYYYSSYKSEKRFNELRDLTTEDADFDYSSIGATPIDADVASDGDSEPKFVEIDGKIIQSKFAQLYSMNPDFIGWIKIDDTIIDYPVMMTPRYEEYYLYKDFDKNYSRAGTIFVDTSSDIEKPSDNIIIYGHHMQTGKMFHELSEYSDEEYYKEHKYIEFDTLYGDGKYEVIAAFKTQIYEQEYTGFKYYTFFNAKNEAAFDNYVKNCMALTPYETSGAEYGDKLITLSTCSYHVENGRYVVVAKKIEE
ncbi:MAG: class B sortase [Wujia sp.]